jgi:hypothetical protein
MSKFDEQQLMRTSNAAALRPWSSGEEFVAEARTFVLAATRFIGRGEPEQAWSEAQWLRLELAHIIEAAGTCEQWTKRLYQMVRIADGGLDTARRRLAVKAIERWGEAWKQPKWQTSLETRRACLTNLAAALETIDPVFGALRRELDNLATKLDEYARAVDTTGTTKTGEQVLAELIVEGTDALGFDVEPRESMHAEARRIERQLVRDTSPRIVSTGERRSARRMRSANPIETDEGKSRTER